MEVTKQHKAAEWLLDGENPAVRYWTLRDILGKAETDDEVVQAREHIATWTPVAEYLREQHSDGYWGFGEDVYWPKWTATVWPLILLAEIGIPGSHPSIRKACEYFLRVMDTQDRPWPQPKYPDDDNRAVVGFLNGRSAKMAAGRTRGGGTGCRVHADPLALQE